MTEHATTKPAYASDTHLPAPLRSGAQAGQFLTFALGQEEYGVEILKIQEIKGFSVDAVSDVLTIAGTDIQPAPALHGQVDTSFLTGLAKAGEKLVLLLDIDQVLTAAETAKAAQAVLEAAVEAAAHN